MESFTNLYSCRICLNFVKCEIELESSLEINEDDELIPQIETYLDCYCFVSQIKAELNENTSNKLCTKCVKELLKAYNFIRKAQKAEKGLQQLFTANEKAILDVDPLEPTSVEYAPKNEQNTVKTVACEICGKEYGSNNKLKMHRRKHEIEPTNCDICHKKFASKYNMRRHMRTHETERTTFDCNECDRKYYNENSLMVHKRIHTGNMLECDECLKKFDCNRELLVHKNSHRCIYQYICDICGARYKRINHLNTHMIRHKGLKAQCLDCGKLFSTKQGLHEHSFVHSGKMPFPCNFCERGYPCRQKYKVHLKNVHNRELTEDLLQKCIENVPITTKKSNIRWIKVNE